MPNFVNGSHNKNFKGLLNKLIPVFYNQDLSVLQYHHKNYLIILIKPLQITLKSCPCSLFFVELASTK